MATPLDQGRVQSDVALGPLTTYKVGGSARLFASPDDEAEIVELARVLADEPVPVLVLGRGSNLLVADAGFDGLVIHPGPGLASIDVSPDGRVIAGASASLPLVARTSVRHERSGLEWCVGVPGSVGGAVRMNAGCHGSDTAEVLVTARVVDLDAGTIVERTPSQLEMGYRTSNLTQRQLVVGATFATEPGDRAAGERRIKEITRWRREHQPGGTLNAGSVFKNPPGDAAGRIIDAAGLKGHRRGAAQVSHRHANFIEAGDGATAQDIYDLVWEVRRLVGETSGIWLVPEIRFAGSFRPSVDEAAGP